VRSEKRTWSRSRPVGSDRLNCTERGVPDIKLTFQPGKNYQTYTTVPAARPLRLFARGVQPALQVERHPSGLHRLWGNGFLWCAQESGLEAGHDQLGETGWTAPNVEYQTSNWLFNLARTTRLIPPSQRRDPCGFLQGTCSLLFKLNFTLGASQCQFGLITPLKNCCFISKNPK